jgi:NADH dehydrogenase/NADH:ubiquinone oxidoreductase subunit G
MIYLNFTYASVFRIPSLSRNAPASRAGPNDRPEQSLGYLLWEKKTTMKTNLILAAVIAGFAATVATQAAALPCADSKHVQAQLTALHGEVLTHSGRLQNSNILQLFMNERDESWSILERWSRKFGPGVKMDRMMKVTIQNDKTKEPFARIQSPCCA